MTGIDYKRDLKNYKPVLIVTITIFTIAITCC